MNAVKNNTAIGMIATAEPQHRRGRFAPSPSGSLHLGSLLTAVGSYLDAKHQGASWLVRIEDIDRARSSEASTTEILKALEACGLQWDGAVLYQHTRLAAYEAAFHALKAQGHLYPCQCSRARLIATDGRYPGTCKAHTPTDHLGNDRSGNDHASRHAAWRFDTESYPPVTINDRLQGTLTQPVHQTVGDFVVRRRDGEFTYQLAVVVDDAHQGITDVVRGADLFDNTPRQRLLQRALGLSEPTPLHLPVLVEDNGAKLSKSRRALALDPTRSPHLLSQVLAHLGHAPPADLVGAPVREQLSWAVTAWRVDRIPARATVLVS